MFKKPSKSPAVVGLNLVQIFLQIDSSRTKFQRNEHSEQSSVRHINMIIKCIQLEKDQIDDQCHKVHPFRTNLTNVRILINPYQMILFKSILFNNINFPFFNIINLPQFHLVTHNVDLFSCYIQYRKNYQQKLVSFIFSYFLVSTYFQKYQLFSLQTESQILGNLKKRNNY